tara:strand:+ start:526 stop:807 length:282 start_codon:yes stop_codon:yes gene_type:complete
MIGLCRKDHSRQIVPKKHQLGSQAQLIDPSVAYFKCGKLNVFINYDKNNHFSLSHKKDSYTKSTFILRQNYFLQMFKFTFQFEQYLNLYEITK